MPKSPDEPKKAKNPARPTRAKAAREPLAPLAPHLEKLLNPGIAKGTAGVGSQTGLTGGEKPAPRGGRLPGAGAKEAEPRTGLRPPADNSWDRREDFSAAHRARKSTREGAPSAPVSPSLPSPLRGGSTAEGGRGGGPSFEAPSSQHTSTPTPNPSPQGGGEHTEYAAPASQSPSGFSEAPQAQYTSN